MENKELLDAINELKGAVPSKESIEAMVKAAVDAKAPPAEVERPHLKGRVSKDETDKLAEAPSGGFRSLGHFATDVVKAALPDGGVTPALRNWSNVVRKTAGYMEEGDNAQGGFTVPTEFANRILEKSLETSIVRGRASIQPMTTNRLEIPADVDSDHSTNYFGGVTIYRTAEGAQKTATNPTFAKIALNLHKLTGLVYVSDELLDDSGIALDAYLTRKFGQAIAFVEDDDFLNGTGAGMATGAFASANPSRVSVTAETGQAATTIVAENIIKMWARLYPAGHGRAVWVANIECFPQLAQMSLAVGTGGIPVWTPAGGVSGRPYETLMGAPLLYSEKMQALGTVGDVGLADFSQYLIGQKGTGAPAVASSMHIRFDYDETAFRFVTRYDGTPTWTSALTPKRGSATLSPFVVIATRS